MKSSFAKQFKKGAYPAESPNPTTRVNGREPDAPSKVRKRQGVALGSQTEAYPGMSGKADYPRKRRK